MLLSDQGARVTYPVTMGAGKTSNLPAHHLRKSNATLADILRLHYVLDKTK
jgi:hypothetical protein